MPLTVSKNGSRQTLYETSQDAAVASPACQGSPWPPSARGARVGSAAGLTRAAVCKLSARRAGPRGSVVDFQVWGFFSKEIN